MKKKFSERDVTALRAFSSPVVVFMMSTAVYILLSENLYITAVLLGLFVAIAQYAQHIVIREEREEERKIVFNSLKNALIEEYRNEELDNERSEE